MSPLKIPPESRCQLFTLTPRLPTDAFGDSRAGSRGPCCARFFVVLGMKSTASALGRKRPLPFVHTLS